MSLLDTIQDPKDLKCLELDQLHVLADEIRQFILKNIAVTGGHLASNLGIVELTIGLHTVFNSPEDRIIWDVGHQSYVHKILTNRRGQFNTLRQHGGISGFPKRLESNHDIFETGHSSTSISAALGIARARDIKGEKHHVLAVIGDGALSGGMAFEALNDAGHTNTNLIVILNDNEMSISQNVGAISSHLAKIRSNPQYKWVKKEIEQLLRKIPKAGPNLVNYIERLKNSFKYLVVPGVIFEEMGFTYMGPIDGHNLSSLLKMLRRVKDIQGPVFIHVITKKGKGYIHAEKNPALYHGVPPFTLSEGCTAKDNFSSYSSVFGSYLVELAKKDPRIAAITAAMPDGTGLTVFKNAYPHRFFDVGIAEQHAVTLAAGLAINGIRPVVAVYSTFLQRAYDQILHDVCQQNLPVVFAIDRAGLVGEDGETHQGVFDISYLRHMPNITIIAPKNTTELKAMLRLAFTLSGPVAIRYPKGCSGALVNTSETMTQLNWEIIKDGWDVVLLATGYMVHIAMEVTHILNNEGIDPLVVNARVIKPLDTSMLDNIIPRCSLAVTLEDNVIQGGFGSCVNEYFMEKGSNINVINIGIPDLFIRQGAIKKLQKDLFLDAESIAARIRVRLTAERGKSYAGFS